MAGSRVDAAFYLQTNTFRNQTSLQLQLVDIRPSLTASRHEADALELRERCCGAAALTAQEKSRLRTSREQFGACWTVLERQLRKGKIETAELPFLRRLAVSAGGNESFLRTALALEVFAERGLITLERNDGRVKLCLVPIQGKVDLFSCPYLQRLQSELR